MRREGDRRSLRKLEKRAVVVGVGWDEDVEDGVSVAGDDATESMGSGDQPPGFAQRRRLRVGPQVVAERGVLGEQQRCGDGQGGIEQCEGGQLRGSGEQAQFEGTPIASDAAP